MLEKSKKDCNMKPLTSQHQLNRVIVNGFKSIRRCDLPLSALNIMIGANGAGKSNLIAFFRMIQQLLEKNLQRYVGKQGGPDAVLHFGRKTTETLDAELHFGNNGYKLALEATHDNRMMFAEEAFWTKTGVEHPCGAGHFETRLPFRRHGGPAGGQPLPILKPWRIYHFHDTGDAARVKQPHGVNDNAYLRPDARNLAAFLYLLQNRHEDCYRRIVKTIRLAAPFFGDFHLRPSPQNEEIIELEWVERDRDAPFKAHHLSDGTLRFICLTVVFLQPEEYQPETILVDEPELGLHPAAIALLASMMRSAAATRQIVAATQSVEFLNQFDPEDVVVVDRRGGESILTRLDPEALAEWLQDYSLGELWIKNILGGRPAR